MAKQRSRANSPPRRSSPVASAAASPASKPTAARIDLVDAARGFAVAMMIAYHFCFDLTYYGWADWPMLDDPRWIAWRSTIVTCFLFLVGVSLALRDARDQREGIANWFDRSFMRRWAEIALAALLVTAGSALLFPDTFIYFGVLHFVAVALWLCRRAPRRPWLALMLAGVVLAAGLGVADDAFNPRLFNWIGFATEKPLTEDYVPLFPWLAVALIGCWAGGLWARAGLRLSPTAARLWQALPDALRATLAKMGRWSLTIYLVHQPLLIGALGLIKRYG